MRRLEGILVACVKRDQFHFPKSFLMPIHWPFVCSSACLHSILRIVRLLKRLILWNAYKSTKHAIWRYPLDKISCSSISFLCLWIQALADSYFKGLANEDREPSTEPISKLEFEFENRKLTKDDVRELIYREVWQYSGITLDSTYYLVYYVNNLFYICVNRFSSIILRCFRNIFLAESRPDLCIQGIAVNCILRS